MRSRKAPGWIAVSAVLVGLAFGGCKAASLRAGSERAVAAQAAQVVRPAPAAPVPVLTRAELLAEHFAQVAVARQGAPADAEGPVNNYVDGAPALEPVDPLLPPPGDVPAVWQKLDQTVRAVAAEFPGRMSVVAVDLTGGARYAFRPNDRYYPASTFKLPVTICTVQAIARGELTWDTLITFTPADDDTVGQGGFANAEYGSKWPVRNLLDRSIISSNNVAVKMLARTLTWDGLADCTRKLGGTVTRSEAGSTPVSAADEAAWWLALWQMKQTQPAQAEDLLRPLRQVPYYGRIVAGTPRSDLVTHKFGTYPPYEHDGAIVWSDRPYILVVLTYGGDHYAVDGQIEQIAGAAWESIMGK